MKKISVILTFVLLLPVIVQAATIPESSDVVLVYDNADIEQQGKYNFLYTVNDDDTIYSCTTNRCSTIPVRDKGLVTMTIYKLPEGFPRTTSNSDQGLLAEYIAQSEQTYVLENISTDWASNSEGRPYQLVNLYSDGTFQVETQTYSKPDINKHLFDDLTEEESTSLWFFILSGIGIAFSIAVLVYIIYRIIKARRLQE